MFADFFTKSFQEALFVKFRKVIMGLKNIDTLHIGSLSTNERVVNVVKAK